jgi:hypothetical protein
VIAANAATHTASLHNAVDAYLMVITWPPESGRRFGAGDREADAVGGRADSVHQVGW